MKTPILSLLLVVFTSFAFAQKIAEENPDHLIKEIKAVRSTDIIKVTLAGSGDVVITLKKS